jgi:hypothetical protein
VLCALSATHTRSTRGPIFGSGQTNPASFMTKVPFAVLIVRLSRGTYDPFGHGLMLVSSVITVVKVTFPKPAILPAPWLRMVQTFPWHDGFAWARTVRSVETRWVCAAARAIGLADRASARSATAAWRA